MGRAPCCEKVGLKRGRWATEEDDILTKYIQAHGEGSWRSLPKNAGLLRCGKSCRLRWINYLRSDLRRGNISSEEEETIIKLHASLGNRWSLIASHLPGRTDNEIKNYWNSHLGKKIDSVPSSNQAQQQEQTDAIDSPKPAGNTVFANKSRAGQTGRPVMKKKKNKACNISTTICDPPLVPKLLEKAKENVISEFENGNGIVPMPATPTMEEETMNIGSMLLESNEEDKEVMGGICLDSSCFNDMVLNNIDGSLEDLEVVPNGVLANTVSSGPILEEGNKMAMLTRDQEDLEINLSSSNGGEINGEWYSCNSSTNSYSMNEEEEKLGWDYWDLDGGVQTGQEYLWDSNIEEEKMLSWLWDTTTTTENDEGECTSNKVESGTEKQNAMVAWLLS